MSWDTFQMIIITFLSAMFSPRQSFSQPGSCRCRVPAQRNDKPGSCQVPPVQFSVLTTITIRRLVNITQAINWVYPIRGVKILQPASNELLRLPKTKRNWRLYHVNSAILVIFDWDKPSTFSFLVISSLLVCKRSRPVCGLYNISTGNGIMKN